MAGARLDIHGNDHVLQQVCKSISSKVCRREQLAGHSNIVKDIGCLRHMQLASGNVVSPSFSGPDKLMPWLSRTLEYYYYTTRPGTRQAMNAWLRWMEQTDKGGGQPMQDNTTRVKGEPTTSRERDQR